MRHFYVHSFSSETAHLIKEAGFTSLWWSWPTDRVYSSSECSLDWFLIELAWADILFHVTLVCQCRRIPLHEFHPTFCVLLENEDIFWEQSQEQWTRLWLSTGWCIEWWRHVWWDSWWQKKRNHDNNNNSDHKWQYFLVLLYLCDFDKRHFFSAINLQSTEMIATTQVYSNSHSSWVGISAMTLRWGEDIFITSQ